MKKAFGAYCASDAFFCDVPRMGARLVLHAGWSDSERHAPAGSCHAPAKHRAGCSAVSFRHQRFVIASK